MEFCAVCRLESPAVPMSTGRHRPKCTCLRGLACAMFFLSCFYLFYVVYHCVRSVSYTHLTLPTNREV